MVNQEIVKYLQEGQRRGFSLNLLKQKLTQGGFATKDVEEAARVVGSFTKKVPMQQKKRVMASPQNFQMNKTGSSGAKWMKIGGVVGIVLFSLALILFILSFFVKLIPIDPSTIASGDVNPSDASNFSTVYLIMFIVILVVFLVMVFLYYFGFAKLGKYLKSKMLSISSWSIIVNGIVLVMLSSTLVIYIYSTVKKFSAGGGLSNLLGFIANVMLFVKIISVVLLVGVIFVLLFSIALIKAREIKFLLIAGILYLILIVAIFGVVVLGTYNLVLSFTSAAGSSFVLKIWDFLANQIVLIVVTVLSLAALLFGSLGLLNAAKKFG